jgi:hypothetical protein
MMTDTILGEAPVTASLEQALADPRVAGPAAREQALRTLSAAHLATAAANRRLAPTVLARDRAVIQARRADPKMTWQAIADIIGMAQPNTVRKYKPIEAEESAKLEQAGWPVLDRPAAETALREAAQAYTAADARVAADDAWQAELEAVAACRNLEIQWDLIAAVVGQKQGNAVRKYEPHLQTTIRVRVRPPRKPKS